MPEAMLTNPTAAFAPSSDYTTYLDGDGNLIQMGQRIIQIRANDTIAKWQSVALVAATATVPLSCELLDVSDALKATNLYLGVAQEAGVAGDIIRVCTQGVTLAKVDTTDPVSGSAVVIGAADGQVGALLIGSQDATVVANTVLGVFLDVENASDYAAINLYGR